MPLEPLSRITPDLFPELERERPDSTAKPEARQKGRAADWQQQLARAYNYAQLRARNAEESDRLTAEYEEALRQGPDFTRYRRDSGFMEAPKLSIDRNAAARIKFQLEAIRRGSWKVKEKGKHAGDIKHSVIEVFDALVRLAFKHRQVFPSLVGIAYLATRSKQTVVNALNILEFYGFITVHRRIKRISTPLGFKTVQATNAYAIHEPNNSWGRLSYALFMGESSESKNTAARKTEVFISTGSSNQPRLRVPWEPTEEMLQPA